MFYVQLYIWRTTCRVAKMADCLQIRRRQNLCCLNCRCTDSVHFFRFPKDYRRQLWSNYCEHFKPGFTLKESYRLCSVSKNALRTVCLKGTGRSAPRPSKTRSLRPLLYRERVHLRNTHTRWSIVYAPRMKVIQTWVFRRCTLPSYRIGVEKRRLGSLFVLLFVSHFITITYHSNWHKLLFPVPVISHLKL